MKYLIDNKEYDVIINRKNNKNLYVRVKEDLNIYVTCNYLTTNKMIIKVLDDNKLYLRKMIDKISEQNKRAIKFFYLGGLGENGKNMFICDVDERIFILDAGLKYPSVELYGIDTIIPDIQYLKALLMLFFLKIQVVFF